MDNRVRTKRDTFDWTKVLILFVVSCFVFVGATMSFAAATSGRALNASKALKARGLPPKESFGMKYIAAPGYCESYGGSTYYEAIQSVSLTPNQDGTYVLTVEVFISNPTGCKPGEPCGAYDGSPEYVNAWIDWNGDKSWSDSERVMDVALTGYAAINYFGTMTAIAQFSAPDPTTVTKDPTWMRVNLGYGTDPNNPCMGYWTYGNVVDKEVHPEAVDIKIKSISAKGFETIKSLPTAGSLVELEAEIEMPDEYEVVECSWTGDLTAGQGDPANKCYYNYTPATGLGPSTDTYGDKNITLTVAYQHTVTAASGNISKDHSYKVFFWRDGRDNGPNNPPNWFEYWKANGAVPQLARPDVRYKNDLGGYGMYSGNTDLIYVGPSAARIHYPGSIIVPEGTVNGIYCPGGTFGGDHVNGIDTATEVVEHEGRHKWVRHQWDSAPPAGWSGMVNTDFAANAERNYDDSLPDDYETSTNGTSPNATDTCLLQIWKSDTYKFYGDNEWAVMVHSNGKKGVPENDWSSTGKQAPAAAALYAKETDRLTSKAPIMRSGVSSTSESHRTSQGLGVSHSNPEALLAAGLSSALTGVFSDTGIDTNANGLYNSLRLRVGVQVQASELLNVVAWIEDGGGNEIGWASTAGILPVGSQTVDVLFDGPMMRASGLNGPYKIVRVELRATDEDDLIGALDNAYTTGSYLYTSFDPSDVVFAGTFSDTGIDSGSDGLYDILKLTADINVYKAGIYNIIGELTKDGEPVAVVNKFATLATGLQTLALDFDGRTIFNRRLDGPYKVKVLRVQDASLKQVAAIYDGYTTATAYSYDQFQHEGTTINTSTFSEQALDLNGDAVYDYLRISVTVNVDPGGLYTVSGILKDSYGDKIATRKKELVLASGVRTVNLDFQGSEIFNHGVNGPYMLTSVSILDSKASIVDAPKKDYITAAYAYTDFSKPPVELMDTFSDAGVDTNANGYFDILQIDIPITANLAGLVKVQGSLVDGTGTTIEWSENTQEVTVGSVTIDSVVTIPLLFTGKTIWKSGKNGPYYLRNLLVYNTGYPDQTISVSEAYMTKAYTYTEFEGDIIYRTFSVVKSGDGSGSVAATGLNCTGNTCTGTYVNGTSVTVVPTANTGSVFAYWTGACVGETPTCNVVMNSNLSVGAVFVNEKTKTFKLGVSKTKTSKGDGTVTSSDNTINCGSDCSENFYPNAPVVLTAVPSAGSVFSGWSAPCAGTGTCAITMDKAYTVKATFIGPSVLTVGKTAKQKGTGTVTSTPAGIDCGTTCTTAKAGFIYNSSVMLTATPATDSVFTGWSGTGVTCPGTGTCTVTMDKAKTVKATFTGPSILTVGKTSKNKGTGTVTSTPAGIDCGTTCTTAKAGFIYNSSVMLTAAPALGTVFTGWSGTGVTCPGTGTCTVKMEKNLSVKATFTGP